MLCVVCGGRPGGEAGRGGSAERALSRGRLCVWCPLTCSSESEKGFCSGRGNPAAHHLRTHYAFSFVCLETGDNTWEHWMRDTSARRSRRGARGLEAGWCCGAWVGGALWSGLSLGLGRGGGRGQGDGQLLGLLGVPGGWLLGVGCLAACRGQLMGLSGPPGVEGPAGQQGRHRWGSVVVCGVWW